MDPHKDSALFAKEKSIFPSIIIIIIIFHLFVADDEWNRWLEHPSTKTRTVSFSKR